jgi:gliding motility-associated-like protein
VWNSSIGTTPGFSLGSDTTLCAGQTLTLNAPTGTGLSYQWADGLTSPSRTVSQAGTYTLTISSPCGSPTSASIRVDFNSGIKPTFSLGPDTTLCAGQTLTLNAPTGPGLSYQWADGLTSPSRTIRQAGTYTLTISSPCRQSASASVQVAVSPDSLAVPNIITPNGDNLNDAFVVSDPCSARQWSLSIYTRWGQRVFQTELYANDWRGSDLSAGTYYYWLKQSATQRMLKGWVEIVR